MSSTSPWAVGYPCRPMITVLNGRFTPSISVDVAGEDRDLASADSVLDFRLDVHGKSRVMEGDAFGYHLCERTGDRQVLAE